MKFPATTCGYSMGKIAHFDNAFSDFFGIGSRPSIRSMATAKRKAKATKKNK